MCLASAGQRCTGSWGGSNAGGNHRNRAGGHGGLKAAGPASILILGNHRYLPGLRAAAIPAHMTSKNENDETSRALQEDGVPRLMRSRHINPQRGLHDKPGKLRQTLR